MKTTQVLILLLAMLSSSSSAFSEKRSRVGLSYVLSTFEYKKFLEHTENRLPSYKKSFKKYAVQYQVPWTLIAAVGYQESKWKKDAKSHTGVKGLMQLTTKTAEFLGVNDREDPHQSIQGGALYLKYLFAKTPNKLQTNQRWALALTAYNIGWRHLRDAQRLALQLKKDPYNWSELKTILPKLENPTYYSKLTYGYARGNEAVDFVDKVFNYYNLMNETYSHRSFLAKFEFKP